MLMLSCLERDEAALAGLRHLLTRNPPHTKHITDISSLSELSRQRLSLDARAQLVCHFSVTIVRQTRYPGTTFTPYYTVM
jgi:hypothetical protein